MDTTFFLAVVAADVPWPRFAGVEVDVPALPSTTVVDATAPLPRPATGVDVVTPLPRSIVGVDVVGPLPCPVAGVAAVAPMPLPGRGPPALQGEVHDGWLHLLIGADEVQWVAMHPIQLSMLPPPPRGRTGCAFFAPASLTFQPRWSDIATHVRIWR